jgi:hypothetical protein
MRLRRVTVEGGVLTPQDGASGRPPIVPGKIIGIGLNYRAIEDPFALRPAQLTPPLA